MIKNELVGVYMIWYVGVVWGMIKVKGVENG
jgi:hypothetical protein